MYLLFAIGTAHDFVLTARESSMAQFVRLTMRLLVSTSLLVTVTFAGCSGGSGGSDLTAAAAQPASTGKSTSDPPEVTNGERLLKRASPSFSRPIWMPAAQSTARCPQAIQ